MPQQIYKYFQIHFDNYFLLWLWFAFIQPNSEINKNCMKIKIVNNFSKL